MADQNPVAGVATDAVGVTDLDGSAHGVLGTLTNDNHGEQAGVIMQAPDGKYYNTSPIASNHDHFGLRVQLQQGWKIAGVYHTHPGNDDLGQYFSPNDIAVAESLKVPSYVRFQKDGSVRKYVPGQTTTQTMNQAGNRFGMRVSRGDDVPLPQASPALATATPSDDSQKGG